jgi:hypothetical protein
MSIRRRRKKLTSLISSIDRRVNSTTLRQVKKIVLPASDVVEEQETTTEALPPVGTVIAEAATDEWARVTGGFYYSPDVTGGLGQVELFLNQNLGVSTGNVLYVSGTEVKWSDGSFRPNTSATSTNERVVLQSGLDWTGRTVSTTTKKPYRPIPTGSISSVVYTITNKSKISTSVPVTFRAPISSYFASTTTTGSINFSSPHHFVVGHILDIADLPAPFRDVDGIIQVSAVPSTSQISFTFSKAISATIPVTAAPANSFAYAVVSLYRKIGSSVISPTTQKISAWDGLRWVGYTDALAEGLIVDDGLPPAAPTNLNLSSFGYAKQGVVKDESRSAVQLSWTAPTTNTSGNPLIDLAGYRIWISTNGDTGPWSQKQNFGKDATTQTILDLVPDVIHYFAVIAYDTTGLDSQTLTGEIVTTLSALSVEQPSLPIVLPPRLGTVTIKWDGEDVNGAVTPPRLLNRVEVHVGTSAGFTPSETTLKGTVDELVGLVISDLEYNLDYYVKLVSVDIHGKSTTPSASKSFKVLPLVDTDLIAARLNAPLSSWPFAPKTVTAGALADGSLDASTVFGPDVITQNAIAADAIGADQIAANAITAGKINAGAVTAGTIAALAIETGNLKANAITAEKINAGAIETEKIKAGAITAEKIAAKSITGEKVLASTSITFASEVDTFGNPTSGSNKVVMGTHQVPENPAVFVAGISFSRGTTLSGLIGTSTQWPGFIVGDDWIINAIQWTPTDSGMMNSAYRTNGDVTISGGNGDNAVIGIFSSGSIMLSAGTVISFGADPVMQMGTRIRATNNSGEQRNMITAAGTMFPLTESRSAATPIHQSGATGSLFRTSSSRRYKVLEEPLDTGLDILKLEPKTWIDKIDYRENNNSGEGLTRHPGFIAEDLDEAGFGLFVHHNEDGSAESINYGELVAAIIPVLKNYKNRIEELESSIDLMKKE